MEHEESVDEEEADVGDIDFVGVVFVGLDDSLYVFVHVVGEEDDFGIGDVFVDGF